jgi:hypothetical protein
MRKRSCPHCWLAVLLHVRDLPCEVRTALTLLTCLYGPRSIWCDYDGLHWAVRSHGRCIGAPSFLLLSRHQLGGRLRLRDDGLNNQIAYASLFRPKLDEAYCMSFFFPFQRKKRWSWPIVDTKRGSRFLCWIADYFICSEFLEVHLITLFDISDCSSHKICHNKQLFFLKKVEMAKLISDESTNTITFRRLRKIYPGLKTKIHIGLGI